MGSLIISRYLSRRSEGGRNPPAPRGKKTRGEKTLCNEQKRAVREHRPGSPSSARHPASAGCRPLRSAEEKVRFDRRIAEDADETASKTVDPNPTRNWSEVEITEGHVIAAEVDLVDFRSRSH